MCSSDLTLGGGVTLFDVRAVLIRLASLDGHGEELTRVTVSPDGQTIATASRDNHARLWDARGVFRQGLREHGSWVNDAAWSPDGAILATAGEDGAVKLWGPNGTSSMVTWRSTGGAVRSLAWSPDGALLAVGTERGAVDVWDVRAREIGRAHV